jgi:hypothetical protein
MVMAQLAVDVLLSYAMPARLDEGGKVQCKVRGSCHW